LEITEEVDFEKRRRRRKAGVGFELILKDRRCEREMKYGQQDLLLLMMRQKSNRGFKKCKKKMQKKIYFEHEQDALRKNSLEDLSAHALIPSLEAMLKAISTKQTRISLFISIPTKRLGRKGSNLLLVDSPENLDRALRST
jgi:hypothetical protein